MICADTTMREFAERETLELLKRSGDATSEEEGVMLDYVNPLTGGPTLPTIDSHAQYWWNAHVPQ